MMPSSASISSSSRPSSSYWPRSRSCGSTDRGWNPRCNSASGWCRACRATSCTSGPRRVRSSCWKSWSDAESLAPRQGRTSGPLVHRRAGLARVAAAVPDAAASRGGVGPNPNLDARRRRPVRHARCMPARLGALCSQGPHRRTPDQPGFAIEQSLKGSTFRQGRGATIEPQSQITVATAGGSGGLQ